MFKSLRLKLILIFFVLILSVMAVLSTFLLNSITSYYFNEFNTQVSAVFTTEVLSNIEQTFENLTPADAKRILDAYNGQLGIDSGRDYYVLDGNTAQTVISSSEDIYTLLEITPNLSSALAGELGISNLISADYLDIAIPINDGEYIIYVIDDKGELFDMTLLLFTITIQAMFVGIVAAVLLSLFLSKTMTNPIENLTRSAKNLANAEFREPIEVQSHDEIGVLTQTFNTMSDMLNQTINKVEQEKNKLSTLFLHMTDGVLAFESNGTIINMNLQAEKMLEISFDESLTFADIFKGIHLPEYENEQFAETIYEISDKTYRVLFADLASIESQETGIIVMVYDITESTKLEEARKEFVANVSHELRTPLTNIKSYTETILENRDYLDKETEERFLGIISGETDRMTRIVKDLLTLSKLDHGKMEMTFERLDLKKLLKNVYDAMILQAQNSNISLNILVSNDLGHVNGDRARLEQVIVNIVSNAIKYSAPNKKVKIYASNAGENVKIAVIDQGFGIPEGDLGRIFDRFYRVDKARSREKGGTGLGLSISKNIIEAHGGSIKIESVVEKGSTVTILLPISKGDSHV